MKLFNGGSEKSRLQQGLDRDKVEQGCTVVEELPAPSCECSPKNSCKRLFKEPKDTKKFFQVDLLGGWVKP
jgi:hypothetical protein